MAVRRKARGAVDGGDERYIVVDGRRWRRSDPGIPATLQRELVDELMDARRAVGAAKRAASARAEKAARARVQCAKEALGERGHPYWEEPTAAAQRKRATATIRALLARRNRRAAVSGDGKRATEPTICPSDVARTIGGEHWREYMQLVREVAAALVERGELRVLQRGREVAIDKARGPIRLARSGSGE